MNDAEEWYDVKKIGGSSYAIWELEKYACYLIEGSEKALLIDTGVGVGDLEALVTSLTDKPVQVLITHSHWDHIGNATQFDRVFAHPGECADDGSITIDGVSRDFVQRPEQAMLGWKADGVVFPDHFDPETYEIESVSQVENVFAGEVINLGDRDLELLALPGHSPNQLGVLDRETEILYGADLIGNDRQLLALFEHTSIREYACSVRLTQDLYRAGAFDTMVTGHLPPLTNDDLEILSELVVAFRKILAEDVSAELIETKYGEAMEYSFDGFSIVTR